MTLESIVLPLAESRALVEAGIVLDTAMVWVIPIGVMGFPIPYVSVTGDSINHHFKCVPAPVLSELLDAIREKQPYAVVQCGDRPRGYVGSEKRACSAMQPEGCSDIRYGDTDLLAACALLMEVAK